MSIGNGGIIGKKNTVTTSVASGVFTINEQIKFARVNSWPKVINVSVAPNITVVNEGDTVTFDVIANGIDNGTTLYWTTNTVSGTINTADFSSGTVSGSFTVSNGTGQITRSIAVDGQSEPGDAFSISIRSGSIAGPILATSASVTISNLVFTIQTSVNPVSEGSNITFDISYTGISNEYPIHYEVVNAGGSVNAADFTTAITGNFVTDSTNKNVTLTLRSDQFTEGTESFYLRLRFGSLAGSILAISETVNITDSSVNPTITFTQLTTNINEGVTNNITINASPTFQSTVSLTYVAQVLSGTINFDGSNAGILSNFSSSASFSLTAATSGTAGTYRVDIIRDGVTIAQSAIVTVNDAVGVPTTMTFVTSATGTGSNIILPATAQVGDIAIFFDFGVRNDSAPLSVVPTGFTQIVNTATGGAASAARTVISYKVLVAFDPGNTFTGMGVNTLTRKTILIFRPNNAITTVTVSTPVTQVTTATPSTQTINMAGQTTPLIGFGHYAASGDTGAVTSSLSMTEVTNSTQQKTRYIVYNVGSTPQSGTISMTDKGTNSLQSFFIRFA